MNRKNVSSVRPAISTMVRETVLNNGMKLFLCPRPGSGTVFTLAAVKTGSIHEGKYLGCGLSHFLEHMAFSGTEDHPGYTEIAERVDRLGGRMNACTGYTATQYHIDLPASAAKEAVNLISGMIARPLFPEKRFFHEKDVILRESAMRNDSAATMLYERLFSEVFTIHPLRIPIIGYGEKIRTVDREMMLDYYRTRYAPGRTAFIVAGDIDPDEITDYIEKETASWAPGRLDEPALPPEPEQNAPRTASFPFNDPLARIAIAFREPGRSHKDHSALEVLSQLLGGSDSSRLVRTLCLKEHLADAISTTRFCGHDFSLGILSAITPEKNLEKLRDGIEKVLKEIRTKPVGKNELQAVAAQAESFFWDTLRDNAGIARLIAACFISGESLLSIERYPEKIAAVTAEDVMHAASNFRTEELSTTVSQLPAGPARKKESGKTASAAPRRRSKATSPAPALEILPGGTRLVIHPGDFLPMVDLSFWFPGGSWFERRSDAGAAALLGEWWLCGTGKYSETEFNELLDQHAIKLYTETKPDALTLHASCPEKHLPLLKELLKSVFQEPLFLTETFDRERSNLVRALESERADPRIRAFALVREKIFGKTRAGGFSAGFVLESARKLTCEKVEAFYRSIFNPAHIVASIGGAISKKQGLECLKEILGAFPASMSPRTPDLSLPLRKPGTEYVSEVLQKAQAVVMYAFPMVRMADLTCAASLALSASDGMASRLFKSVREDRGLAYYAMLSTPKHSFHSYGAYLAGTKPGAEKEVLRLFEEERKIRAGKGFSKEEFEGAKAAKLCELAYIRQDAGTFSSLCAMLEYRDCGIRRLRAEEEMLKTVTRKEVNLAAKHIFSAPSRVMAVVSPEKFSDFPVTSI